MKRILLFPLSSFLLTLLMLVIALKVPVPLATNSDFKVIYYTDQALTLGIDVYDHPAKIQMINEVYDTSIDENFMPQFAYPPWYALTTFYLGYLPIQNAAVLWFEINLVMLFLSIWFLTDGWKPLYRLLAFPAAFLFLPIIGTLVIGQYDFPVLLGTSMLIYAIKHKHAVLTAFGIALLTFKPHLGGLILIAGLIYLLNVILSEATLAPHASAGENLSNFRRDPSLALRVTSLVDFGKKSLTYILYTGIFLFLIGFLTDSSWLVHYIDSLLNYRGLGHITTCSECVNISVWLARSISGESSLSQAGAISGVMLTILLVIMILIRPPLWKSPALLLTSALIVTILASPYLYNYDFILLLVPFALLTYTKLERVIMLICYLGSTIVLAMYGREGNNVLLVVSIMIAVLLYLRARSQVDVPALAS